MLPRRWLALFMAGAILVGGHAAAQPAAPPPPGSSGEPAEIGQLRRELLVGCRSRTGQAASFGPQFLRRANLTPDELPDFVVDVSGMTCPGAAGAFCRGRECPVHVFVSFPGGYRRMLHRFAEGVDIRPGEDRDVLVFGQEALAWDGNLFTPVAMPAAPAMVAPAAAAAGPAWRLDTAPRLVAASPPLGMVRAVNVYCDGPLNPVVEVAFTGPMPPRVDLTLESGAARLQASFLRHSPVEALWRADVHGAPEAARLLAGALAPVDVAVNGMPQGSLPIGGAEAALRQALGRCLRLPAR